MCKETFSSKWFLEKHLSRHTKNGLFSPSLDRIPEAYKNFMVENFDMTCDHCDTMFSSLYEARFHYKDRHNDDMGYIKCCKAKFQKLFRIVDHINSHWNPDRFK